MRARMCLGLLILMVVAGCASAPVAVHPMASFNTAKARKQLEPGQNRVVGKVLLRLSSGGALTCAGGTARLIPVTPYAAEWAELVYFRQPQDPTTPADFAYLPKSEVPKALQLDPAFLATTRSVPCDRDGQFRLEQVADGDYFLEAQLLWQQDIYDEVNFFHGRSYAPKEGTVLKRFHVQDGQQAMLDLQWTITNRRFNF